MKRFRFLTDQGAFLFWKRLGILDAPALISLSFQNISVDKLCSKWRSEWDLSKNILVNIIWWELVVKGILKQTRCHFVFPHGHTSIQYGGNLNGSYLFEDFFCIFWPEKSSINFSLIRYRGNLEATWKQGTFPVYFGCYRGQKNETKILPLVTNQKAFFCQKTIGQKSIWIFAQLMGRQKCVLGHQEWSVHDREAQNEMTTVKSNIPWSKLFILYWACVLFFKETVMLDQLQGRTFIVFLKTPASRCGQVKWL